MESVKALDRSDKRVKHPIPHSVAGTVHDNPRLTTTNTRAPDSTKGVHTALFPPQRNEGTGIFYKRGRNRPHHGYRSIPSRDRHGCQAPRSVDRLDTSSRHPLVQTRPIHVRPVAVAAQIACRRTSACNRPGPCIAMDRGGVRRRI